MAEDLDFILGGLEHEDARLRLLKKLYIPGNVDVADRILAKEENSSILEQEAEHADKAGDEARLKDMATRLIDVYISRRVHNIVDLVIEWNRPELTKYAIELFTQRDPPRLDNAIEIAEGLGMTRKRRGLLEKALALEEEKSDDGEGRASTLAKLKRYDEAIDRLIRKDVYGIKQALDMAKEHSTDRLTQIAKRGFSRFRGEPGEWSMYVECGKILGKMEKVEKAAIEYYARNIADSLSDYNHFPDYLEMVETFVACDEGDMARKIVHAYNHHIKSDPRKKENTEELKNLAKLYHAIDDFGETNRTLYELIELENQDSTSYGALRAVEFAVKLTGEIGFNFQIPDIHVRRAEFREAAAAAKNLGRSEMTEEYTRIQGLIDTAADERKELKLDK